MLRRLAVCIAPLVAFAPVLAAAADDSSGGAVIFAGEPPAGAVYAREAGSTETLTILRDEDGEGVRLSVFGGGGSRRPDLRPARGSFPIPPGAEAVILIGRPLGPEGLRFEPPGLLAAAVFASDAAEPPLRISAAALAVLRDESALRELIFDNVDIAPGGLAGLRRFPALRRLEMNDVRMDDAEAENLAAAPALESLTILGAPITDASIPVMARLTGLRELGLYFTRMTRPGLKRLRAALPASCRMSWTALPEPPPPPPPEPAPPPS